MLHFELGGKMELTAKQQERFEALCREIKPGEYGRVEISFIGEPSNLVKMKGEKNFVFHNEKDVGSVPVGNQQRRSGRYGGN
jgi:hypothetical protein